MTAPRCLGRAALALPLLCAVLLVLSAGYGGAALLVMQPGAIDHPLHLVAADLDGDGYDDLAYPNFQAGTVTVLMNQRDGTFAPQKDSPNIVGAATFSLPSLGPLFLATADINKEDVDGDRVPNNTDDCPNVYNPVEATGTQLDTDNNGVGDACQTTTSVDTDGDGVPDYDPGTQTLDNCPFTPNPGQEVETAEGLDGLCGTLDDNTFLFGPDRVCLTAGDNLTSRVGAACSRSPDLVVLLNTTGGTSSLGLVRVRVNDRSGGLKARFSLQASVGASRAVLADFNGDLRDDLVVSNSGTDALLLFPGARDGDMGAVCLNGSRAGFSCVTPSECPGGTCRVTETLLTAGTCFGGTADGATCATVDNCPGGGACRPFPATGGVCVGGFQPGIACTTQTDCPGGGSCRLPSGPEGLAAGDFNGDAIQDLAFANRVTGNIGIFLNAGPAKFTPAPAGSIPAQQQPVEILAARLDNDACDDLVVLEQGPLLCQGGTAAGQSCSDDSGCPGGVCRADHGMVRSFLSTCTGGGMALAQTLDLGAGHVPRDAVVADFDGDTTLDLAVADYTGGDIQVFRGLGGGTFAAPVLLGGLSTPVALATLQLDAGGTPDLAVLSFVANRVDLFVNASTPGLLAFTTAATPVASPWGSVSAMTIAPADASTGQDLVLLNATPPRLDVLSGTGTTFRGIPSVPLEESVTATAMIPSELRQDGVRDFLILDGSASGKATPVITTLLGTLSEQKAVPAGNNPVQAAVAPLSLHPNDYDQDGVLDAVDDCPTRYNPPNCPANDLVNFANCFVDIPCKDANLAPVDCVMKDPTTQQCDSDGNGIGDQCQILDQDCNAIDTDLDTVFDYNPATVPASLDNCPWTPNPGQTDSDTPVNHIGDLCDSSVCILAGATGTCLSGPLIGTTCRSDGDCAVGINDVAVVDGDGGGVTVLIGDASGGLRPAPASWAPVTGLSQPVGAAIGRFTYDCFQPTPIFPLVCNSLPDPALSVAERGSAGSSDDVIRLFVPATGGGFQPAATPPAALQGDPSLLLVAPEQRVCGNPWVSKTDPRYHFDDDGSTSVLAVVEPETSTVQVLLPAKSLVPAEEGLRVPPGNPNPLPLASRPVDALFSDLNVDGVLDLVVLSGGDGDPSTPNLTLYLGMGNGLFFTDPSINPTDVPDGMRLLADGQVNLALDSVYPDVVLFDSVSRMPLIMTNILPARADIDQSGRVDGYDLALLARAFGAERGENWTLQPDGTLLQNPDLNASPAYSPLRVVVGSGGLTDGKDAPTLTAISGGVICDHVLEPVSPLYGLPVDINLDGEIDGVDLALLASRFGRTVQ